MRWVKRLACHDLPVRVFIGETCSWTVGTEWVAVHGSAGGPDPGAAGAFGISHLEECREGRQNLPMSGFVANADYEEKDADPIRPEAGDEVTVGLADRAWPGWVWARDDRGRAGYLPEGLLEPLGEGRFALLEDFDPTVLKVSKGDRLESLKQNHGWHWCRSESGSEGWVAGYLLKSAE